MSGTNPELECRSKCVNMDGCVGYTVKLEPPLVGQCVLKKTIGEKFHAEKYTSGTIYVN